MRSQNAQMLPYRPKLRETERLFNQVIDVLLIDKLFLTMYIAFRTYEYLFVEYHKKKVAVIAQ